MKSKKEEIVQSVLLLLKLDSQNLYNRIKNRKNDYLQEFSLKRTREPFKEIFFNRYGQVGLEDLKHCGQEVLVALDQFYTQVDEMKWYLCHTQDMTNTVSDKIDQYLRLLKKKYEILTLYLDADLGHGEIGSASGPDSMPEESPLDKQEETGDIFATSTWEGETGGGGLDQLEGENSSDDQENP